MPTIAGGNLKDRSLRSWLARSDLSRADQNCEQLARITRAAGLPYSHEGLGALRLWGQTGERPSGWIAALDPVYLEPRLDTLWLHALGSDDLAKPDLDGLVRHLQHALGEPERLDFIRLGNYAYLRTTVTLQTASVSSALVNQQNPGDYLPQGAATGPYRNLLSEIEMALHEHAINQRRVEEGHRPVNSLWIWGGGLAPAIASRPQPTLFADDPLALGYWASASAPAIAWPGDIAACLDTASEGFVAVVPQQFRGADFVADCLDTLRRALRSGRLSVLTLLFRDGLTAEIRRSHVYRVWRRDAAILDGAAP